MKKLLLLIVVFSFLVGQGGYAPDYGPTDWDVIGSTTVGWVAIGDYAETLNIFGEPAVGGIDDGSMTGSCPTQDCDIVAAMYNGQAIGWSYCTVSNGQISFWVNFNDWITPGTENYPWGNDYVTLNVYDASTGLVHYGVTNSELHIFPFSQTQVGVLDVWGDGPTATDPAGCPSVNADNFDPNAGSGNMCICESIGGSCGCTDESACNYDSEAQIDSGCWYNNPGCDCEDGFGAEVDCLGECEGPAELDECGTCNGVCNPYSTGCDGFCDCEGNILDCNGDCGGTSMEDSFGVCCNEQLIDECGECNGNGWDQCDFDNDGIPNIEDYGLGAYDIQVNDIPNDNGGRVYVSFHSSFMENSMFEGSGPGSSCIGCEGGNCIYDCYMQCIDEGYLSWVGDGWCDNGEWGVYFFCEEFNFDNGDCFYGSNQQNPHDRVDLPIFINQDERNDLYAVERLDGETWVAVQTVVAYGQEYYTAEATTISDSTSISDSFTEYRIIASFEDEIHISNETGIGYSLDNIAPSIPSNLFVVSNDEVAHLLWDESSDPNLQYYSIYRNGSFYGYADQNTFIDFEPTPPEMTFYQISATDYTGNSSSISDPVIPSDFILGDITIDGQINILDIILLVNFLLVFEEPTSIQEEAADFNQDGAVNISDAVSMVNFILEQ